VSDTTMLRPRTIGRRPRAATAEDQHVGRMIRIKRQQHHMSQTDLANEIGVTFQQVQKYERGRNRVSAGRLQAIAQLFKTPISGFLPEQGQPVSAEGNFIFAAMDDRDVFRLVSAFQCIENSDIKKAIVAFTENLAASGVN
jgi:transcriptional regulator with XRE-family HTH domain